MKMLITVFIKAHVIDIGGKKMKDTISGFLFVYNHIS